MNATPRELSKQLKELSNQLKTSETNLSKANKRISSLEGVIRWRSDQIASNLEAYEIMVNDLVKKLSSESHAVGSEGWVKWRIAVKEEKLIKRIKRDLQPAMKHGRV